MAIQVPLLRYRPGSYWEGVRMVLDSPRPDGSVAYYQDSLSACPEWLSQPAAQFDDEIARALCRWLTGMALSRKIEVVDGPYLQVMDDNGTVPPGFVVIRALVWVEEFDLLVPVDTAEAVSG